MSPAPLPWGWIGAASLALLLAAAAGIRQTRTRQDTDPQTEPARTPGPVLGLRISPQARGLPPVWHPGEATTLHMRLTDAEGRPIRGAQIRIQGPTSRSRLRTDRRGQAHVSVPPLEAGSALFRARFPGDEDHPATEATIEVRLVEYREEIDRAYRDLHERAHAAGLIGPDATPRELTDALGCGPELADLFERCDFSQRPVTREHYERFMQARQEAWPQLEDG